MTDGDDTITGDGTAETLEGKRGDDRISGGGGNDTLRGGFGDDTLIGGAGDDFLAGNDDADLFRFGATPGRDVIADFDPSEGDLIDLLDSGRDFSDLRIEASGTGALISFDTSGAHSIFLRDFDAFAVEPEHFLLPSSDDIRQSSGEISKFTVSTSTAASAGSVSYSDEELMRVDDFRDRYPEYDGKGLAVVVVDYGIDLDHRAFDDRIVYQENFAGDGDTAEDGRGHGTHVASIIGSSDPRYPGIAPGVDLIVLKVLPDVGDGSIGQLQKALRLVVDELSAQYDIAALNMSLSYRDNISKTQTYDELRTEFADLNEKGIVVTVSAGNDYGNVEQPGANRFAADPNVIPVGNIFDSDGGVYSGRNDTLKANPIIAERLVPSSQRSADMGMVFAPGYLIDGAQRGTADGVVKSTGTSFSAPAVAGMAVLAQQMAQDWLGRRLTPGEFHALLLETSSSIGDVRDDVDNVENLGIDQGLPRVDLWALAQTIRSLREDDTGDEDDFDADAGTSGRVALGGSQRGEIETALDADWFAVTLRAGNDYVFEVAGAGDPALSNPVVRLIGPDGTVLASDDDSGPGRDALLAFSAAEGGKHFLAVSGVSNATGGYRVSAERTGRTDGDDFPENDRTDSEVEVGGGRTPGTIETEGDRDWHAVVLEEGAT